MLGVRRSDFNIKNLIKFILWTVIFVVLFLMISCVVEKDYQKKKEEVVPVDVNEVESINSLKVDEIFDKKPDVKVVLENGEKKENDAQLEKEQIKSGQIVPVEKDKNKPVVVGIIEKKTGGVVAVIPQKKSEEVVVDILQKVEPEVEDEIPERLLKTGIYSTQANEYFEDIAFPLGAFVDVSKTAVYEDIVSGKNVGALSLTVPYTLKGVFDFYMNQMNMYGWDLLSYKTAGSGEINYVKKMRQASFSFEDAGANGTLVKLKVGSR
jgi:hypothetical protein